MTSSRPVIIRTPVFAILLPTKPMLHRSHEDNATTAHAAAHSSHACATLATTLLVFSIVISFACLIILIYYSTKHCRTIASSSTRVIQPPPAVATAPTPESNSTRGVDPAIIQQYLPLFSFRFLRGINTHALVESCAVCLIQYEDTDILRFLPSCHHAFHVECIDKWLESRCSCPLCRHKVSSSQDSTITLLVAMEEASNPRRSLEMVGGASRVAANVICKPRGSHRCREFTEISTYNACLHQEGVITGGNQENSDGMLQLEYRSLPGKDA